LPASVLQLYVANTSCDISRRLQSLHFRLSSPSQAGWPTLIELIFPSYDFALRGSHIYSESKQEATGNRLLHCDTRARVGVIAAQRRINGQTGEPGQLLDSAADLTRRTLGHALVRTSCCGTYVCCRTLILSTSLRSPAYDCAMRTARSCWVSVSTLPVNTTEFSSTLASMFVFASAGSELRCCVICCSARSDDMVWGGGACLSGGICAVGGVCRPSGNVGGV